MLTCTDNMALLSSNLQDLQMQIQVAESYAKEERYTIHSDKTKVVKFGTSTSKQELSPINLNLNNKGLKLSGILNPSGNEEKGNLSRILNS